MEFDSGTGCPGMEVASGRFRVLCLGPWASEDIASGAARAWAKRLATLLNTGLDCQVVDPPYSTDDFSCKGYWVRPVARTNETRTKLLRKQTFASLITMMQYVTRWKPDIILGVGQGAFIAGMSTKPLVLEAACRSRVTPLEVMREYREAWANVRAIVLVNPSIMPQRTLLDELKKALPEVERLQPAGVPCEILISRGYLYSAFARSLGGLLAAPVNSEAFDARRVKDALS